MAMIASVAKNEGFIPDRLREFVKVETVQSASLRSICDHEFIQDIAKAKETEPCLALLEYMRVVAARLDDEVRIVVTVTLNLDDPTKSGYPLDITKRRVRAKKQLETAGINQVLGRPIPKPDATYRTNIEANAIRVYADALCSPVTADIEALSLQPQQFTRYLDKTQAPKAKGKGRVVVLGAAVMDVNFLVHKMPDPGTSVQARRFLLHPGGKGLTQAVACSRLGLETRLISIVGNDELGARILRYLKDEKVDTSLVRIQDGASTAVTGVFSPDNASSMAIGWKNEDQLRFPAEAVTEGEVATAIREADILLASFELPSETVGAAITLAASCATKTIITPAPPYDKHAFDKNIPIDFLVSNVWEMMEFAGAKATGEPEQEIPKFAADLMFRHDIGNVIVTTIQAAHAYLGGDVEADYSTSYRSHTHEFKIHEGPGDRDAFCAMLASRLASNDIDRRSLEDAVDWATAAMCAVSTGLGVPSTMPGQAKVKRILNELRTSKKE